MRKKIIGATANFVKKGLGKLTQAAKAPQPSEFVKAAEESIARTQLPAPKPPSKMKASTLFVDAMQLDKAGGTPVMKRLQLTKTKSPGMLNTRLASAPNGLRVSYDPTTKTYYAWDANEGLHHEGTEAIKGKFGHKKMYDLTLEPGDDAHKALKEQIKIHKMNEKEMEGIP